MNTKQESSLNQIHSKAVEWFLLMQDDHLNDVQLQEFDTWLAREAQHREAYLEVELASDALLRLSETEQGQEIRNAAHLSEVSQTMATSSEPLWQKLGNFLGGPMWQGAALASAVLVALTFFMNFEYFRGTEAEFVAYQQRITSGFGEIKQVTLKDGTLVTLGANSELEFSSEKSRRRVSLLKGEAFFNVSKDASRPFFVGAGSLSIKVVGTQFDVRKRVNNISVGVIEGVVQVYSVPLEELKRFDLPDTLSLVAGQQAKLNEQKILQRDSSMPFSEMASWRNGKLVYKSAALQDVLADANRYSNGKTIVLQGDSLLQEPITLSLNISQVSDLPQMLLELLPVKLEYDSDRAVLIEQ